MTVRILFLREGTSDDGIAEHIENIAAGLGIEVALTNPDLDRLNARGHAIGDKLSRVRDLGGFYEVVAVHRDADNAGHQPRVREIDEAVRAYMPGVLHVPVVPVRMTEAWLLVDEPAIRRVAGNPNGRCALDLPQVSKVETIADPKKLLKQVLATASELSGRRLKRFNDRFPENRRQLLQRLDTDGPVTQLPSWQAFVHAVEDGLYRCGS